MSFGFKRTKKTKPALEAESLGNLNTYACDPLERGSSWARPLYRPAFVELDAKHLQQRTWLR